MKKLVVVRHGDYEDEDNDDEKLSSLGEKQIAQLAEKLESHLNGFSVVILSSTALRARQSAEILVDKFGAAFEGLDLLWSGEGGKSFGTFMDFKKLLKMIEERKEQAEVYVLVTHYEYIEDFPMFFGKQRLGATLKSEVIPKGTAWLIDCEKKEMIHVR